MERASRTRSSGPPNATSVHTWCLALTRRNPDQVEEQCKDPQLMHCGLEKCVAADGSVEWVAAHSKARLEPHLPPTAHSHTAPVPNARVSALSHPLAGTLPARGRQVPHLEPARPGSLFELELAGIKRRAEKNDSGLGAGGAAVCKYTPKIALQTCVCVIVCYSGATRRRSLDAGGGSCNVLYLRSESIGQSLYSGPRSELDRLLGCD